MSMLLKHLAIILDGNRRWAKAKGLPKLEGHRRGYERVKDVGSWCVDRGIEHLTVYAFSTENWNREPAEVKYLMGLLHHMVSKETEEFMNRNLRVKIIGQRERLAEKTQRAIEELEKKTVGNTGGQLNVCISYGGRPEIVEAVKEIVKEGIEPEAIDEEFINQHLWTGELPDADLIIRTSGEQRLSNFLTWKSAYSEIYFTDAYWPDFDEVELDKALDWYEARQRRFGR